MTAGVNRVKLVGHCLDECLFVGPPGLLVVHKIWAFSFDTWHGSQQLHITEKRLDGPKLDSEEQVPSCPLEKLAALPLLPWRNHKLCYKEELQSLARKLQQATHGLVVYPLRV